MWFREDTTATAAKGFSIGDFLQLSSELVLNVLDPTANANLTTAGVKVLGIALANKTSISTASATKNVPVHIMRPNTYVLLPIYKTGDVANSTYATLVEGSSYPFRIIRLCYYIRTC